MWGCVVLNMVGFLPEYKLHGLFLRKDKAQPRVSLTYPFLKIIRVVIFHLVGNEKIVAPTTVLMPVLVTHKPARSRCPLSVVD